MIDISTLNEAQQQAVSTTEGAVLVLAGAGTGKTRVLTTRIAHILASELAFPSQILAVTFTNKAAREMRERIEALVGIPQAAGLWLGTFHSLCLRMIRRHTEQLGLPKDFTIIDQDDQLRLIKQLIKDEGLDPKRVPPKMVAAAISSWKDKALTVEKAQQRGGDSQLLQLYAKYQQRLRQLGVADFDDLLLHCITLLMEYPEIAAEYQRRFRYILVDEYQDTNVAQYLWLRLLAQGNRNICCVGDDDQSIYGWRGAEVENILRFEKDFPGTTTIRLEQNYRSTPAILAAASGLIAFNENRLGKTLYAEGKGGEKLSVVSVWDERAEAQYVAQQVMALRQDGLALDEMAVLVRAGHQTRPFEERFIAERIPYRILGGLRFYERMEIRDAIAYMRVVVNPHHDLALQRIINVPKRGIGAATIAKVQGFAGEWGISMVDAIPQMVGQGLLKGKVAATLTGFIRQCTQWRDMLLTHSHVEVVDTILQESGYREMWQQEKTPEAEGRCENLKELLGALAEFETLDAFLEHVALVMDGDDAVDEPMVSIMTMHGAKGLEFDTVFLPGWEEGLFPSQKAMDENGNKGLEEERRLAYVGITRAKRRLLISFAATRYVFGQSLSCIPSRFIDELPKEHIQLVNMGMRQQGAVADSLGKFLQERRQGGGSQGQGGMAELSPANAPWVGGRQGASKNSDRFRPGQAVQHSQFGRGIITKVSGKQLTVAFKHGGVKTLMQDYVQPA